MDAALFKRRKISETLLTRARAALPRLIDEDVQFSELEKEFQESLERNEHELALDALEEMGDLVESRGGFWKDLIRVAENMELVHRIPNLQKKFDEALLRRRNTKSP